MGLASKADLLRAKVRFDDVAVPGVGTVRVRGLTGGEMNTYRESCKVGGKFVYDAARLVLVGAVDDDGAQLFDPSDLASVRELSNAAIEPLANRIGELSGIGEDHAGNSGPTPGN